ncbi:unnamed protein product, partial [Brenthis ino]
MKFILALWAFCISSIRAQWFNGQQQIFPNIDLGQNIQNNNDKLYYDRNPGRAEPDAYDKYIEDILKQRNSATSQGSLLLENSDQSNTIDRIKGPYESNESSDAVRFIGVPKTDIEQLNNITYAITTFGINLMKSINQLQNGNIIVSPTSVATVLALLQQGTVDEAQNEITKALQMPASVTAPTYQRLTYDMKKRNSRNILTVSNNLYIGAGFEINPDFKATAIKNFGSEVTPIDFSVPDAAVRQINKWISIQTHNKISNLLSPDAVKFDTQLVIANAVYFKGLWETKFKQESTKPLLFHLSDGKTKTVPFMRMRHSFRYGIDEETDSLVVVLPFERIQYSLVMILPHKLSNVDIVLNSLTNMKLVNYQKLEEIEVQLAIPKFTIKSDTDLIPVLKNMGISSIFSRNSDLTGIGNYRTYSPEISRAVHTGFLSVDEQGLSAAAVSGFTAVALSYEEPSNVFQADRPFLAVLWDTQFAIPLFVARVDDPSI